MKTLLTLLIFSMRVSLLHAQTHSITSLHNFMQENADTTVIMSYSSNWFSPKHYMLLSKKGDTLTSYQYKNIDDITTLSRVKVPSAIRHNVFYKRLQDPVDVHGEFHLVVIKDEILRSFWRDLQLLDLWSLKDDSIEGLHCPQISNSNVIIDNIIIDASTIHLDLITKGTIKALRFYGPAHYEKVCTSRSGRKAILEVEKLFLEHFR